MSTPFHFSPHVPSAPRPTPLSSSSYSLGHPKHTKAPIYNPYDKFTQPEFDAWIGGITGALRKALGEVDDEPIQEQVPPEHHPRSAGLPGFSGQEDEDDLALEDSFAEIKARRAQGKGKARDPREGPGLLGAGDKEQPIEILSDDEEEARADSEQEEEEEDEGEWDEDVRSGDEEEEDPEALSWERGQEPLKRGPPGTQEHPVGEEEYDEEENEEYESDEAAQPRRDSSEVIEVSDSEDASRPQHTRPQPQPQQRQLSEEEEDYEEEYSGEEEYEENEEQPPASQPPRKHHQNERFSPEMVEDDDEEAEDEEIQPSEDDTSFPPHASLRSADAAAVDIPDPWKGPQTYAEDFYSGGDAALLAPRNAHKLGPSDLDYEGFLTPGVGTPAELEEEGEEEEEGLWDEEEGDEEDDEEQLRRGEDEPEIIAVDSDEDEDLTEQEQKRQRQQVPQYEEVLKDEEEEEGSLLSSFTPPISPKLSQSHQRPEEDEEEEDQLLYSSPSTPPKHAHQQLQEEEENVLFSFSPPLSIQLSQPHQRLQEDEEEDQLPRSSPPISSPIEASAMFSLSPPRPHEEGINFDELYDDMEMQEAAGDNQRDQAEIMSTLVDWNFPPAFPTGVHASASGHLATPSSEEEDGEPGQATFMSVHMESSITSPFGRQESIFAHLESTPRGPASQAIGVDADEEECDEEEEEEDVIDTRDMPLGTSDLDVRDLDEGEEGKQMGDDDGMEVVMPDEVVEAETEEDESKKGDKEEERRAASVVEEVIISGEPIESEAVEPPAAGAVDEKEPSPEVTIIEDTEEVEAVEEQIPAAVPSPAEALGADTSGEAASIQELVEVQDDARISPEAESEPEIMELPKPSEDVQEVEEIQPAEGGKEVEVLEVEDVQDMGETMAVDEAEESSEVEELQYPEEPRVEEEVQPAEEEIQPAEEGGVQLVEDEIQVVEPPTSADQPEPTQEEPASPHVQPTPIAAPLPHYPTYDYEQLPTPPSEQMHTTELPSVPGFDVDVHPPHPRHSVEIEEVPDEDATPPGSPAHDKFTFPADVDMDIEIEESRKPEEKEQEDARGYLVDEVQSEKEEEEQLTDEDADADGEIDWEVDVVSVSSGGAEGAEMEGEGGDAGYTVEEPLTETDGRLTEEPSTRATSLGVVSVGVEGYGSLPTMDEMPQEEADVDIGEASKPEEVETSQPPATDATEKADTSPEDDSDITFEVVGPTPLEQGFPEAQELPTAESHAEELPAPPAQASSSSVPLADNAPPVSADPNLSDPTESPVRQNQPHVLNLPGTPTFMLSPAGTPGTGPTPVSIPVPQSILKALKDHANYRSRAEAGPSGLFTPGERSGAATPDILFEVPQENAADTGEQVEEPRATGDEESKTKAGVDQDATDVSLETQTLDEHPMMPEDMAEVSDSTTVVGPDHGDQKVKPQPAVDVFGSVETTEASQLAAAAFALAEQSAPQSSASPYHSPGSSEYSMRVPMTRKPTDPILFADPYPWSLSTPGSNFLDTSKDDESSEGTEQENSMTSSSTMEKDQEQDDEEKATDNILDVDDIEDPGFRYPFETEVQETIDKGASFSSTTQLSPSGVGDTGEADADGDLDPEFLASPVSTVRHLPKVPKPVPDVTKEEDPFKLMGTDSTVAPGAVLEDASSSEAKSESTESLPELVTVEKSERSPPLQFQEAQISREALKPDSVSESKNKPQLNIEIEAFDLSPHEVPGDKPVAEAPSPGELHGADVSSKSTPLPSKRKRTRSPAPARLTRSASTKKITKSKRPSAAKDSQAGPKANGKVHGDTVVVKSLPKGKEKAKAPPSRERSVDSWSSGASAAARLLRPSSRASSVASTAPSDKSLVIQPSPTANKPNTGVPLPPPPPPPLFHAHGSSRNKLQAQPPALTVQQQLQRQMQRIPSFTRSSEQQVASPTSTQPSQPPPVHRGVSASSSPVTRSTRSQCRYHKISLPKEEGGPRVCFLVPGCSLTDRELMDEEEIEDHGDATHEDSLRMVTDIESLDFDAYLIGILRQLVGVDILREQEVFYLPSPGEDVPRKILHRRTASEKAMWTRVSDPGAVMGSPSLSAASVRSPTSSRAPPSIAGSAGTSTSVLRRARGSDKGTHSDFTETESESSKDEDEDEDEDELPKAKRVRPSPPEENASTMSMGPPTSQPQSSKRAKAKRGKRLRPDHLPYKPDTDHDETSVDEDETSRPRRKQQARRGLALKRARPSGEDAGGRKSKKLKFHPSDVSERS